MLQITSDVDQFLTITHVFIGKRSRGKGKHRFYGDNKLVINSSCYVPFEMWNLNQLKSIDISNIHYEFIKSLSKIINCTEISYFIFSTEFSACCATIMNNSVRVNSSIQLGSYYTQKSSVHKNTTFYRVYDADIKNRIKYLYK